MSADHIILQSAGSLSVAILGLLMVFLQAIFLVKNPEFKWFGWSAAISFSGMLYATGAFLQYNATAGALCRFSCELKFTAIILLIHSLYGFTFSFFGKNGTRYHIIAGPFHIVVLLGIWFTDYLFSNVFQTRHFYWLATPFFEPVLGPLTPYFELYAILATLAAIVFWIHNRDQDPRHRYAFIFGISCWLLFGIHDSVVSLGVPSIQYFMEYGYFFFSAVVLWFLFSSYADIAMEDKYRAITELANDGILVIQDDRVVFGNPASHALIGKSVEHLKLDTLLEIVNSKDRRVLRIHYDTLLETGVSTDVRTARIMKADGEERIFEIRGRLIQYRDKPAVLAVLRDATERIREEKIRKENAEKLFRLRKMESLGLLAGGVAHDLNNILSGIINYPELILYDLPQTSPLRKPIETIKKSGLKAAAIVQDLLTVARGAVIVKENANLNTILQGYLCSPEYEKMKMLYPTVSVKTDLASNLLNMKGSSAHIGKLVMNLVSNAFEAVEKNGTVVISTENRYLDRQLKGYNDIKIGEYIVLTIGDSGPGISSEDLQRIFEPFFTKKIMGRSGTGLGLTVVWNIMQDHDGYINVQSDGKGTIFELYFPISREAIVCKPPSLSFEKLCGHGEKILVIDDVESQRDITCHMLERLNYQTKAVSCGETAVEYLKEHRVDLLLLDMIMDPGINGCETYKRIIKTHPRQKAIIVSGFSQTDQVTEAQRLGAGPYLKKPILLEDLGLAVNQALHGSTFSMLPVPSLPDPAWKKVSG